MPRGSKRRLKFDGVKFWKDSQSNQGSNKIHKYNNKKQFIKCKTSSSYWNKHVVTKGSSFNRN